MALTPSARKAFSKWIRSSTWYSGGSHDETHFHSFVWTVCRYKKNSRPQENEIKRYIMTVWDGRLEQSVLENEASKYSTRYAVLCDFLIRTDDASTTTMSVPIISATQLTGLPAMTDA